MAMVINAQLTVRVIDMIFNAILKQTFDAKDQTSWKIERLPVHGWYISTLVLNASVSTMCLP